MALRVCTCRRLYSIVWRTECPNARISSESPAFTLEDSEWSFESRVEPSDFWETDLWQIYLKNLGSSAAMRGSQVTTYLEDRDGKLERIDSAKVLFLDPMSLCIASHLVSQVLDRKQEFMVDNLFTLVFVLDRRSSTVFNGAKESRTRQTLSPCVQSLSSDLAKLLENNGLHPDMELRCEEQTIPAHRSILSARSEVFDAMLQSDMRERRTGSVEIVDMRPEVLKVFLRYLYTGTLPELDVDTASGLYEAGDKYSVRALKDRCAAFLRQNLSVDNACAILALADAHSDGSLREGVSAYVVDMDIPLKSDQWSAFSERHPRVANDVLFRAYKAKCLAK